MILERWFGEKKQHVIVHDNSKGIILEEGEGSLKRADYQKLIRNRGRPIEQVRTDMCKREVERDIEINPLKLKKHFHDNADFESAENVEKVNFQNVKMNMKKYTNELTFKGESFLEGFLGFYGMELNNAVDRYEKRLQAYESIDLDTGEKMVYIAKLRNGKSQNLSPDMKTIENAQKKLREFEQTLEKKQREQLSLTQKITSNNDKGEGE